MKSTVRPATWPELLAELGAVVWFLVEQSDRQRVADLLRTFALDIIHPNGPWAVTDREDT